MIDYPELLRRLARHAGIAPRWRDVWNQEHEVAADSLAALLSAMGLPAGDAATTRATLSAVAGPTDALPAALTFDASATAVVTLPRSAPGQDWLLELENGRQRRGKVEAGAVALTLPLTLPEGYHRLRLSKTAPDGIALIASPGSCHLPAPSARRPWGLAVQLYSLRSERQWGMGDFTDLAELVKGVKARRGSLVGVNPLHALFPALPGTISPYSPSSRLFLNPLYIDVTAVPDFAESEAAHALAFDAALQAAPLVDYPEVARLKSQAFDLLWASFKQHHRATERGAAFQRFRQEGGETLERFAQFHALQAALLEEYGPCWGAWPEAYRHAESPAVARFAAEHSDAVARHIYLQWEADRQLAAAGAGRLYRDLATGTDPWGADSWSRPSCYLTGASVGAPPDLLNRSGQKWGLTTFSPFAFRIQGYGAFIAALRANMRHAGALRIDHVMGLTRLFLIPEAMPATQGAYIRYPLQDLLRIVALESRRQRCMVVGEDLGTVPHGFRPALRQAGILSCRVLSFERTDDGSFKPPARYPALAAASAGTHDLAPIKAWWLGADIRLREALGQYPDPSMRDGEAADRDRDRPRLLALLRQLGLLTEDAAAALLPEPGRPVFEPALTVAIHRFLQRTPCALVLYQAEDLLGCVEMVNLPGTVDEHPNWRRRLGGPVASLLGALETML